MKWSSTLIVTAAFMTGIAAMPGRALGQNTRASASDRQREDERKAMTSFAAGDYQKAVTLLAQLYASYHDPEYLRDMARCHQHLKNPERAIARWTEYLEQVKRPSPKDKAEAEAALEQMRKLQSQQAGIATTGASSEGRSTQPSSATPAKSRPQESSSAAATATSASASAISHEENGKRLLVDGQFVEALRELELAYKASNSPALLHDMALCHLRLGNSRQALELYEDYLVRVPKSRRRQAIEARIRELQQTVGTTRPVAKAASPAAPPSASASLPSAAPSAAENGRQLFQIGKFAEAAAELEKAYRATGEPALLYEMGLCHDRVHNIKRAFELYEDYLVRVPSSPQRSQIEERVRQLK